MTRHGFSFWETRSGDQEVRRTARAATALVPARASDVGYGFVTAYARERQRDRRPARLTLTQVARRAKLDTRFVRELMLASGRPNPSPGERPYTDDDVEVARLTHGFLAAGMPRNEVLEVARVLGLNMAQTTDAIRRMVGNALLKPGDSQFTVSLRY